MAPSGRIARTRKAVSSVSSDEGMREFILHGKRCGSGEVPAWLCAGPDIGPPSHAFG
jgi:hypothetical protein